MLETPESFKHDFHRKSLKDWAISRQLLTRFRNYQKTVFWKENMSLDNPTQKGTLGEIAVCKNLIQLGFKVFVEFGNFSKVDLIAMDENFDLFKIQVKAVESKDEAVCVYSIKSCLNPKYNSVYTRNQVDVFAVYIIDHDLVFYVSADEILKNGKASKFRLSNSKNGQRKKVRYVKDYLNFRKALRDYTPHAQTDFAVGDEIVQTTTLENFSAAGESQCGK